MNIKWKMVPDIKEYVKETLAKEADDIPQEKINKAPWYLDEIKISQLKIDEQMVKEQDNEPLHIQRRDNFIKMIKNEEEILPLIVLGRDLFLVDGYARCRALKQLGVDTVMVLRQSFD